MDLLFTQEVHFKEESKIILEKNCSFRKMENTLRACLNFKHALSNIQLKTD